MRASRHWLLAAAALAWLVGGFAAAPYRSPFPPPSEMRSPLNGATGDMLALALGARRIFADLWFVRLMQYYGTHEYAVGSGGLGPGHEGHHHTMDEHGQVHCHHGKNYGKGRYALFLPLARHVLEVDSSFSAAGLYGAASLAFGLGRAGEAETLIHYAFARHPTEWKYPIMLAAIGYSKASDPRAVARTIDPLLSEPDCPVMLKQLAAFLNKRNGDLAKAAAIYADILVTSKDPFYLDNARKELAKLAGSGVTP